MKKIFLGLGIIGSFFILSKNVNAEEYYYANNHGVYLTESEYNFISDLYWEGYQEHLSLEQYNMFKEGNYFNQTVYSNTYEEPVIANPYESLITPYGEMVSDSARTLTISKVCSTNCVVATSMEWKGIPTIKGYDVMGSRLKNVSLVGTPTTIVSSSAGTDTADDIKSSSSGFGVSIMLPSKTPKITQTIMVTKGGQVFSSYQHAMSNISLANSKNFTISSTGFGKVFDFSGTAYYTYDRMNGVDITV